MARLSLGSLVLVLLLAAAQAEERSFKATVVSPEAVSKVFNDLVDLAREEGKKAHDAVTKYAEAHPDGLLAKITGGGNHNHKRRLQSLSTMNALIDLQQERMQSVQEFFADMLGSSWRDWVPFNWTLPSFDWSHLGEFDYGSNLGDFLDAHATKNITNIHSVKDLAASWEEVEATFCDKEAFTPSKKVPAKCVGPSVTIALVPKVCILDSKSKQILCDPAKLVLTKTPGSCTHKYKSASTWVGHECKITGGAGFSKEETIGGGNRTIPLIDIDIGYEA